MVGDFMENEDQIRKMFLEVLIKKGSLKISKNKDDLFTFKSGRKSPNFINIGALTDGESLSMLKKAYAILIRNLLKEGSLEDFDFIFGPAYKGIPLATLVCEGLFELFGMQKRSLYDRKEEKTYGDKAADKVIVGSGYFKPGSKILIIDDVITTGGTKLDCAEKLKLLGDHKIVGIVLAVDRQEKMGDAERVEELSAVQNIEKSLGVKCFSILTMKDIFDLVKDSVSPEIRQAWIDYYQKYGAIKLL